MEKYQSLLEFTAFSLCKDKHWMHTSMYKNLIFQETETLLYQYRCIVLIS